MEEFDLERYTKMGFIIDHFPIHDFYERKQVSNNILNNFTSMLVDIMVPGNR